jgi:alcohol dehydrogenase class IV
MNHELLMMPFTYDPPAIRVVFGAGSSAQLPDECARLGAKRLLLLATPAQQARFAPIIALLGQQIVGIYDQIIQHVPIETAAAARSAAHRHAADACIAFGGGSVIGLAKAIALTTDLPVLAIPTTYSGSEMTPIWGLTEDGTKQTGRDRRVLPKTVIYDPELTYDLLPAIAGPSGINALAHCIEALYAPDANPITSLMAEAGIRAIAHSLPVIAQTPSDANARADALYGAWLAGSALGMVAMGLHHKLCHTLGGRFNLPHAELHTIILPHAAAYNRAAAPDALKRAALAFGATDAPAALFDLAVSLGLPTSLRQLGLREHDLEVAADLAITTPYPNPAPITRAGIRRLLQHAFDGQRPVVIS